MPRLTYTGDTTDLFGRFLPTPMIESVKMSTPEPDDPQVTQIQKTVARTKLLDPSYSFDSVDPAKLAKISVDMSVLFNADDTFTSKEMITELFDKTESESLYINIFAVKDIEKINNIKSDKLNISEVRDTVTLNTAFSGIINELTDATTSYNYINMFFSQFYQVYSVPFSDFQSSITFTSDTDDEGNPIMRSSYTKVEFLINNFNALQDLTVFAAISTKSVAQLNTLSRPAFAINFSDISYEDIKREGQISKFGDPVFVDQNNMVYPNTPLQALDSKFYKADNITSSDVVNTVDIAMAPFRSRATSDKALTNHLDNIDYVIATYSGNSALLPNLNKSNRLSPSKSANTNTGQLYDNLRIAINNTNSVLLGEEQVVRRIYRNSKIVDLRTLVDVKFDPSYVSSLVAEDYVYNNVLHSNMAKYVPIAADTPEQFQAELPQSSEERLAAYNQNIDNLKSLLKDEIIKTRPDVGNEYGGASGDYTTIISEKVKEIVDYVYDWGNYWSGAGSYQEKWFVDDSLSGSRRRARKIRNDDSYSETRGTVYEVSEATFEQLYTFTDGFENGTAQSAGAKLQLVFPKTANGRITRSRIIDGSTARKNQIENNNNVVLEIETGLVGRAVDSAISTGRLGGAKSIKLVRYNVEDTEELSLKVLNALENYLGEYDSVLSGADEGAQETLDDAVNAVYNAMSAQVDVLINTIISSGDRQFINELLLEQSRQQAAETLFDLMAIQMRNIISEQDFLNIVGYVITPWSHTVAGKDPAAKVATVTSDYGGQTGIIYGYYKQIANAVGENFSEGDRFAQRINFGGALRDLMEANFANRKDSIVELLEGMIEQSVALNSLQIDTGLNDALSSLDIIVKKAGYFFFDYEKFVRKGSFMSRYINVDRMLAFMPEAQEITNNGINITNVVYNNYTHAARMELENLTSPEKPQDFDTLKFNTRNRVGDNDRLATYMSAPILGGSFSFKEFFNPLRSGATTEEIMNSYESSSVYSNLVQRNFNFTGFNQAALGSNKTWIEDYRLAMYNYQFFVDDDQVGMSTRAPPEYMDGSMLSPSSDSVSRDISQLQVTVQDNSYEILNSIIDYFGTAYNDFISNYYNFALENCSFNERTQKFNSFFINQINSLHPGQDNPWIRMVSVYTLYLNMFTDTFQGSYELMLDAGDRQLDYISPETGTLGQLIAFQERLVELSELLKLTKSRAFVDDASYPRAQILSTISDVERPILDHIGDYSRFNTLPSSVGSSTTTSGGG